MIKDFVAKDHDFAWRYVGWAWLIGALLWLSWQGCAWTRAGWDACDRVVFEYLHQLLVWFPSSKHFWAHTNSRMGDWVLQGVIILLAFYELIRGRKGRFIWLWLGFFAIFSAHILWHNLKDILALDWYRMSPSIVLGIKVDLSQWTHWPNSKVWSSRSFPGDHALTLWMVLFWFYHVARPYFPAISWLVLLATLPRLIAGAHWFSDVFVGALSLALLMGPLSFKALLSWAQYRKQ